MQMAIRNCAELFEVEWMYGASEERQAKCQNNINPTWIIECKKHQGKSYPLYLSTY